MSKWVNKEKFQAFKNEKRQEKAEEQQQSANGKYFFKWRTPEKGTQEKPKVYKGRLLPDMDGGFYKKYFFHFIKSADKSYFALCPKTHSWNDYCPWCATFLRLIKGNKNDKELAKKYSRQERYVSNWFIVHDPRDAEIEDEKLKSTGKVRLYEFPSAVEKLIKKELTDEEEGFGPKIFDPEEGSNFIVNVLAKKPDPMGNIWPDYSTSGFSRNLTAIADSEEDIEAIMEQRYSLDEYLESIDLPISVHEKLLKQEGLWEDVEDEFNKLFGVNSSGSSDNTQDEEPSKNETSKSQKKKEEKKDDPPVEKEDIPETPKNESSKTKKKEEKKDVDDLTDEELLDALNDL